MTTDGETEANETVPAETEVTVDGESIAYERTVESGDEGAFEVVVPYAGGYSVGDETVEVAEEDVVDGERVSVDK